jgi:hypothetical protein
MFVNSRNPYMFQSFLFDHPQRAICCALCHYYNVFFWFVFVEYLLGMWPYVYIICVCVCLVLLSVGDLYVCVLGALVSGRSVCLCAWCSCQWEIHFSQTDLPLTRATTTHTNRWCTHTATYWVNNSTSANLWKTL